MEFQHVTVKIYVDGEMQTDPAKFIDVFHAWIREGTLDGLLIDVIDYRHVPAGPGVMLIGDASHYSMDNVGCRWGLRYSRKAVLEGSNEDRFREALQSAAKACQLLESHFDADPSLRFGRTEFDLSINDRALAPNTQETLAAFTPELEAFLSPALGHGEFTLTPPADQRSLFGVNVKTARPFDLTAL